MPARLAMPAALLVLAACSSPAEVAERTGVEPTASASASAAEAKGKTIAQSTDVFEYELSYPAAVAEPARGRANGFPRSAGARVACVRA